MIKPSCKAYRDQLSLGGPRFSIITLFPMESGEENSRYKLSSVLTVPLLLRIESPAQTMILFFMSLKGNGASRATTTTSHAMLPITVLILPAEKARQMFTR